MRLRPFLLSHLRLSVRRPHLSPQFPCQQSKDTGESIHVPISQLPVAVDTFRAHTIVAMNSSLTFFILFAYDFGAHFALASTCSGKVLVNVQDISFFTCRHVGREHSLRGRLSALDWN